MAEPSSASPGFVEVVEMAIDRYMMDVHTCMPGTVVSYDASTQTATIQPNLKRVVNGQAIQLPQVQNVPVVFPATVHAWVRLPIAAGDLVMIHFAERSLDQWWSQGGSVDPVITHKFNLTDAIAVPGLNPKPKAIAPKGAATSLEVANGNIWLEMTATGKFKLGNGSQDIFQALKALLTDIQTGVCVNGSPLTMPTFTADLANFLALIP